MSSHFRSRISVLSLVAACVAMGAWSAPASAAMIGVHWAWYNGYDGDVSSPSGVSSVTGTDGVLPQSNWTNIGAKWYGVDGTNNTNLVDDTGTPTTAAVDINATGAGTCWWVTGPVAGLSNLLVGPWGGDGPGRRANVITQIPYASYDIIAYVNQPYAGDWNVWLDSNPAAPNGANAHAAGSDRYFSPTLAAPGFVEITNTTSGTFPAGNYVVYSGLTGASQTLWLDGNQDNRMIAGFQIIEAVPEPASLALLGLGGLLLIRRRR